MSQSSQFDGDSAPTDHIDSQEEVTGAETPPVEHSEEVSSEFSGGKKQKDKPEEPRAKGPIIARSAFLRGFNPRSGVVALGYEMDGKYHQLEVVLKTKDPLYRNMYEKLLKNIDDTVPLKIMVALSDDPNTPAELISAEPAIQAGKGGDIRFTWNRVEARWTEPLDEAVDLGLDYKAVEFSHDIFAELSTQEGEKPEAIAKRFTPVLDEAYKVFSEQAQKVGITLKGDELKQAFRNHGCDDLNKALLASENGETRRYDIRYDFATQMKHLTGKSELEKLDALANYAIQLGLSEYVAMRATSVKLPDGGTGSLYELNQAQLLEKNVLLAGHPLLGENKELFAGRSHETARRAAAGILAGAMDAAGVPAARPDIDEIEHQKKHVNEDASLHKQSLKEIPEGTAPEKLTATYIGMNRNVAAGHQEHVIAAIGIQQKICAPNKNQLGKQEEVPNQLADAALDGLKKFENLIDSL